MKAKSGLAARLHDVHAELRKTMKGLSRIAVAIYDEQTDALRTFVDSTDGEKPLEFYDTRLASAPSLKALADSRQPRILDDLPSAAHGFGGRTIKVISAGYRSSYTAPLFHKNYLFGFLFFDAPAKGFFTASRIRELKVYADIISGFVLLELMQVRVLAGAVATTREIARFRDDETAAHLERMARYALLIGRLIGPRWGLSEEWVEFLFRFAPLHDVGKVAIPDNILRKAGPLEELERVVMQSHTVTGSDLVDSMVKNFRFDSLDHAGLLRQIVRSHHERLDGNGYPDGLKGDAVPPAARIVAVADVFDALTSARPYKPAWPNDKAREYLQTSVGNHFDGEAVEALHEQWKAVLDIQRRFLDEVPPEPLKAPTAPERAAHPPSPRQETSSDAGLILTFI
jgi:HD-GYP domain-containing protein (c-di-GMP phosphodiesterase class II)